MSRRHRIHGNPFNVRGPIEVPVWPTVFGRVAPFAMDIGFGGGAFLLELARRHPEWDVIGLEIRRHFVDEVIAAARAEGLANLTALLTNANEHLATLVPSASLVFASINFPDPWYKKRHHKRRVLNDALLETLHDKLRAGGVLHVMTDFTPIAEEALGLLSRHAGFANLNGQGFAATSTTGIHTERELSHGARGHPVHRLAFARV